MVVSHLSRKAGEALGYFQKATRTNGAEFWKARDGCPQWVTDLCLAAHGDGAMLLDDWRYDFIVQALIALDEGSELEADDYTNELCTWLASNVNRVGYVDDARDDFGPGKSVIDDLQIGQLTEKQEVLDQVSWFLEKLIEDEDLEGEPEE
jgi:hypothetical protein